MICDARMWDMNDSQQLKRGQVAPFNPEPRWPAGYFHVLLQGEFCYKDFLPWNSRKCLAVACGFSIMGAWPVFFITTAVALGMMDSRTAAPET